MRQRTLLVGLAVLAMLVLAGCQSSGTDDTTTTSDSSLVELPDPSSTTTVAPDTTTTSVLRQLNAPEYTIVSREAVDTNGDELVILLDPTSYDTLTDIDIQDLFAEVVEFFPPVWIAHLVDDPAAAIVVADPDATSGDLADIEDNYLARLDNGFEITYLGPFSSSGSGVLGS